MTLGYVVGRTTDRQIAKCEERTATFRTVGGTVEVTTGRYHDVGTRHVMRKRDHDSSFSAMDKEFEVTNLDTGSQGDFNICGNCYGTHIFAWHKLKCYKCGEKEHVFCDCKKG